MIRHRDKALPVQPFFADLYRGGAPYAEVLAGFVTEYAAASLPRFDIAGAITGRCEELSSPPPVVALLRMLILLTGARNVLEIGAFDGHTAMQMALPEVTVMTVEAGAEHADSARQNVALNRLADDVTVIHADAAEALRVLGSGTFDLIFLDGAKQDYPNLARQCERVLAPRGVLVIDDVLFHGDALNPPPRTPKGQGCADALDLYRNRPGFMSCLLPVGNGVLLVSRA